MDKSGRRFVVHFQLIEQPKNLAEKTNQKTRNYNLDLSSQRGHASKDRRQHLLQLTTAGRRKLVRSLPLWEEAQRQFLSQIGTSNPSTVPLRSVTPACPFTSDP